MERPLPKSNCCNAGFIQNFGSLEREDCEKENFFKVVLVVALVKGTKKKTGKRKFFSI